MNWPLSPLPMTGLDAQHRSASGTEFYDLGALTLHRDHGVVLIRGQVLAAT